MQESMKKSIALFSVLFAAFAATAQQKITSPETAFGFEPGADRKLADWNELTAYFKKLGTESNRVRYEELGKTTEGRPFIAVTISSADNLAHLDHYKEIQAKLAANEYHVETAIEAIVLSRQFREIRGRDAAAEE